jgi:hypothetical protein
MNSLALKGRYRSGQTGQTVNLLALRLHWFESSPAHIPPLLGQTEQSRGIPWRDLKRIPRGPSTPLRSARDDRVVDGALTSSRRLFAVHHHRHAGPRHIRHRRNVHHRRRHHLAAAARADALHSQSSDGHPWFGR